MRSETQRKGTKTIPRNGGKKGHQLRRVAGNNRCDISAAMQRSEVAVNSGFTTLLTRVQAHVLAIG